MNKRTRNDFLDGLEESNRLALEQREAAGDGTVLVYRYAPPWSLLPGATAALEPSMQLAVAELALDQGRLRHLAADGEPIRWIEGAENLVDAYFAALVDAQGKPWSGFLPGLEATWDRVASLAHLQEDDVAPDQFAALLRQAPEAPWRRFDPELAVSHDAALSVASDAVTRAWADAFRTGKILVFRRDVAGWSILPSQRWEAGPPFTCPGIEELKARWALETHAIENAAEEARLERMRIGIPMPADVMPLPLGLRRLHRPLAAVDAAIIARGRVSRAAAGDLAFLLAHDLPAAPGRGRQPASAVKRHHNRGYERADEPFVRMGVEMMEGPGKLSAAAAAGKVFEQHKDKIVGGGNDDSKITRLQRRMRQASQGEPS
ncbi:hypothetical protein H0I76_07425 [Limibaculum sp. M0105]|uniref:Uncharacterized protein n=1 Tax=Thermohalobaculum xanthum TaxID=2753746 RepID=A0A8J7M7B4_9RHOB|nr:hypothetical protein [Thermohalobaculum xanthum]MBK0399015.1 hypothetical protein [Thermohalobaculum xanthum]